MEQVTLLTQYFCVQFIRSIFLITAVGTPMYEILIVYYAICGLCAILLMISAAKLSLKLAMPWLIQSVVALLICIVQFTYSCTFSDWVMMIIEPVMFTLTLYCMLVVHSFFRKLVYGTVMPK